MRCGIVLATVCVVLAGEARADKVGTVVLQLDASNLEAGFEDLPAELTLAIADRIDGKPSQATVSDLALQLECRAAEAACIAKLRRLVKAETVVWGSLAWNTYTRRLKLKLTAARDDEEPVSTTYVLVSSRREDVETEVLGVAEGFLSQLDDTPSLPSPPARDDRVGAHEEDAPGRDRGDGISATTYFILGSGVSVLATGAGFYAVAYDYAGRYALAPRPTTASDAEALAELRQQRDRYATISRVLLVGGAALATWGIVRAVGEHREPSVRVAPTLVEGGGGVAAFGRF